MQKHTPGPWHIGMKPGPILYGPNGEQVADITAKLLPNGEAIANARLIAAAPEMLAALQSIAERLENLQKTIGWMEQEHGGGGVWAGAIVQAAENTARAAIAKVNA